MPDDVGDRDEGVIQRLAAIPERMRRAVAGWSDERLGTPSADGEWPASAILAHVRASDAIQAPRLLMILVRDNPPLPAFDERRWAEVAAFDELDFATSLTAFALQRAELVAALRRVAPDDWRRTGTHEIRGSVTLLDVWRGLVEHEEEHCAQLEALSTRAAPDL